MITKRELDDAEEVLARHGMETKVLGIVLHESADGSDIDLVRADRLAAPDECGSGWWWRVSDGYSSCMTRDGAWEHEPLPSSRTDEFYARCRFRDFGTALAVFVANRSRLVGA